VSSPLRILIVNINLAPTMLEGCNAIAAALDAIMKDPPSHLGNGLSGHELEVRVRPWRTLLDPTGSLASDLQKWGPSGVILGPNETPFPAYPAAFDRFLAWIRARRGPTLGICGGHQALALAHGAPVAPVHAVPAASDSYEGMPKVRGATRIRLMGDVDPLIVGLPEEPWVMASHVDEVKDIPPGFRLLALGDPSRIQILRSDRRPMWGVQFHPERPLPPEQVEPGVRSPGELLLANFLKLAAG